MHIRGIKTREDQSPSALSYTRTVAKAKKEINLSIQVILTQFTIDRFDNTGIKFIKPTF